MKIVKVAMIILGILLLVGGLAMSVIVLRSGEPFACASSAISDKEYQQAIKDWEAAKGTPQENALRIKTEGKRTVYIMSLGSCDEAKSKKTLVTIASLAAAGLGFLLTIVGFFVGRKKATP